MAGIKTVIIPIVQIMVEMLLLDMEEEIEQEVSIQQNQDIRVRNGSQLVFLFQKILKQLNLLAPLFFRFMNGEIPINKDIPG